MFIHDLNQLDTVVSELMGPECTPEISDKVSDEINRRIKSRPSYGDDWGEYLNGLNLWGVWEGLEERRAENLSYERYDYLQARIEEEKNSGVHD